VHGDSTKARFQRLGTQVAAAAAAAAGGGAGGAGLMKLGRVGVYECNLRCKCHTSCANRVVGRGLDARLQVTV
jgi:hypothetical protein